MVEQMQLGRKHGNLIFLLIKWGACIQIHSTLDALHLQWTYLELQKSNHSAL